MCGKSEQASHETGGFTATKPEYLVEPVLFFNSAGFWRQRLHQCAFLGMIASGSQLREENVLSDQPSPDDCAQWLRALAEPIRLRMLRELLDAPCSVTELANRVEVGVATASHHLQVLLHANLVQVEKAGRFSIYRLNPDFHRRVTKGECGGLDFGCCRFELS